MSVIKTPSGAKMIDIMHVLWSETQPIDGHPDPGAITDCWNEVFETISAIESKHTDRTEVQRLRAALVEIKQLLNENRENDGAFQSWNHMQAWKVATQALSTTSEPAEAGAGSNCGQYICEYDN